MKCGIVHERVRYIFPFECETISVKFKCECNVNWMSPFYILKEFAMSPFYILNVNWMYISYRNLWNVVFFMIFETLYYCIYWMYISYLFVVLLNHIVLIKSAFEAFLFKIIVTYWCNLYKWTLWILSVLYNKVRGLYCGLNLKSFNGNESCTRTRQVRTHRARPRWPAASRAIWPGGQDGEMPICQGQRNVQVQVSLFF